MRLVLCVAKNSTLNQASNGPISDKLEESINIYVAIVVVENTTKRVSVRVTREELKEIYSINQEIKMWQKELNKLQCKSLVGSQEITGMPFGSCTSDKVANTATEIVEIETIIKGKLAEIQIQRKKILEYISNVEDSLLRQIMFLFNISCMSWPQVASEIGRASCRERV